MIDEEIKNQILQKIRKTSMYVRINKIQEDCLASKEDAAYLLALDLGIPIYNYLSTEKLAQIRELNKNRNHRMVNVIKSEVKEKITRKEVDNETTSPNKLFDLMGFHPRIVKASKAQFKTGHYADAIFRAFRCIEVLVKEKSKVNRETGVALMHKVFNDTNPIIKLNDLVEQYEIDEQRGFQFIFAGVMSGIRNVKAHSEIEQRDPYRTLEYLSLASLLAKKIDEGVKV